MKKEIKKIIVGVIAAVMLFVGFKFNIESLSVLALTVCSSLIFFYDTNKITMASVKLWCISIGLSVLIVIGDSLGMTIKSLIIVSILWGLTNLAGIYLVKFKKVESED